MHSCLCSVRNSETLKGITVKDLFSTRSPSQPVVSARGSHCDLLLILISWKYFTMHKQMCTCTLSLSFFKASDSTLYIPVYALFKIFIVKCTLCMEAFGTYTCNVKNTTPMCLTPGVQNRILPYHQYQALSQPWKETAVVPLLPDGLQKMIH